MNAEARHGGMRPKRCLPAQFHPITAHYRLILKKIRTTCTCRFVLSIPKSRQTIVTASKTANSPFFAECDPISAPFAPGVNPIPTPAAPIPAPSPHHEIHNLSFKISCLVSIFERHATPKTKVPAVAAGTFSVVIIVTNLRSPAGAGRPEYQDGRRPVALLQQVRGGHGRRVLGAPAGEHTLIPVRESRFAARRCVGAFAPAAAASAPSPDRRRGPRSAARSLRRGGRGRHWPGAAAATSGSFADAPRRHRRGPAGFRSGPASADLRISASSGCGAARVRPPAE